MGSPSHQEVADSVQDLLISMEMFIASIAFLNSFPIIEFQTAASVSTTKQLLPAWEQKREVKKDKPTANLREGLGISATLASFYDWFVRHLLIRRNPVPSKDIAGTGDGKALRLVLEKIPSNETSSDVGTASDTEDVIMNSPSDYNGKNSALVPTDGVKEDALPLLLPKSSKQYLFDSAPGKIHSIDTKNNTVEWIAGHQRIETNASLNGYEL